MTKIMQGTDAALYAAVAQDVDELIHRHIRLTEMNILGCSETDLLNLCDDVMENGLLEDLIEFANSDPAAKQNANYVMSSYKGFKAMMHYRVSHAILSWDIYDCGEPNQQEFLRTLAKKISEEGKVETGIDIHPAVRIGPGCVIDHGVGTKIMSEDKYENQTIVIGETAIIGRNCTILNDVVIGSSIVNQGQKEGRRQPKIGNNVTICAGARLYGKITIGDDVWIGPKCIVCQDIPSGTKIVMENQVQISKNTNFERKLECDGLIKDDNDIFILGGNNLGHANLIVIDDTYQEVDGLHVEILEKSDRLIYFVVKKSKDIQIKNVMLKIVTNDEQWHYFYSRLLVRELLIRCR